jgi:hypothetical protein
MSTKTFQNYYNNDFKFKRKYLNKMIERIKYHCKFITSRNNFIKHKWSQNHLKRMIKDINLEKFKNLKNIENSIK